MDLARTSDGRVLVADPEQDAVLELGGSTGDRWIVSGPGVGSGPALASPVGLAAEAGGALLVVDTGKVVRIDVASGNRTIVSGAGVGTGPAFSVPTELTVEASGTILVTDYGVGAVFRVSPISGNRVLLSGALGIPRGIDVVRSAPLPTQIPALPPWGLAVAALALAAAGSRRLRSASSPRARS